MKMYVFGVGVLLMLGFSMAGMSVVAAMTLRHMSDRCGPVTSIAVGFVSLIALIAALSWSVPPRG